MKDYDAAALERELTAKHVTMSELGEMLGSVKGHLDKRFDAIDRRFDAVDEGLREVNKRIDGLEGRFDRLEDRLERAGVIPPEDLTAKPTSI